MSEFATALKGLLDDTNLFKRNEWAKLLGVKESLISEWLSEEKIPQSSNLNMLFISLEESSDVPKEPIEAFKGMANLRATEVSPLGKQMLPTVWEYMKRPTFSELSSKLAKIWSPVERGEFLEEYYKEKEKMSESSDSNPTANPLYWDKVPSADWSHVLPQEPGWYFWYNLDLSYFEVGAVRVSKDPEKHLEYLRGRIKEGKGFSFYLYQNDKGETLTMYHQATRGSPEDSHVPPADENGRPYVDGYIPFNFEKLLEGELK